MLNQNFAAYVGNKKEGGFAGYLAEQNFYFVLEIEEGADAEKTKDIMQAIKSDFLNAKIINLSSFDHFISHLITKFNLPSSFSIATGYLKDTVFYLKTVGGGKIFLRRNAQFATIIEQDKSASGYAEVGDFFIFTANQFLHLVGSGDEIKKILDQKTPHQLLDEFTRRLQGKSADPSVALFLQFTQAKVAEEVSESVLPQTQETSEIPQKKETPSTSNFFSKGAALAENLRLQLQASGKRKKMTLIAVAIIFCILIWSVVLGVKRRTNAAVEKKIQNTKELVNIKLNQADEVAFLNLPRSLALISEAKQEVDKLKQEVGDQRKEIQDLETQIKEKEGKITKKEEKNYEEFYDLTLDAKGAKGNKFYLDGENVSILDKSNSTIYTLSLNKKSLDKKNASEIKSATFVATYKDDVLFFVPTDGVYKISGDKAKKVIDKDKDWGDITDAAIYNGNLYLLDSNKGDIYKYLVAENGYSEKSSYLKGEAGKVKNANSIAIDSSVYIGFKDYVLKYTAGANDEFSTSWPETAVNLVKIFTSKDTEKVYGWDKAKGAIYVLGKNGTYERQVNSSIIAKADDFIVYNNTAYILVKEKIYKIGLE